MLGIDQAVNVVDCLLRQAAEFGCEHHVAATFAFGMEYRTALDWNVKHFLQAEGLGAELGVVIIELAAFALLVFYRQESAVGVLFDHITLS